MGTFYVGCKVENHKDPKKVAVVTKLLVDTGSEFTWLPGVVLERIGVEPVKKDLQIQMANGQIVTRSAGYAILRVDKFFTIDEVVFAQEGDLARMGGRAMSGMNARLDEMSKRLADAGPVLAAGSERWFRSGDFQSAVSPTCSRQGVTSRSTVRRLQTCDTADCKSALHQRRAVSKNDCRTFSAVRALKRAEARAPERGVHAASAQTSPNAAGLTRNSIILTA